MLRSDDLRAIAKQLYDQAPSIDSADDRLAVVLKAMEFEADADAMEIGQGMILFRTRH
jgi:Fe-S-cluster formation regulator IscX/YfhJ